MSFQSLGLGPGICRSVREQGYSEPTPIQSKAIPVVLAGRDLIGVAQTGTGKTAAFVLPLLERLAATKRQRGARALIIAPTRELASQIDENIRDYAKYLHLRHTTIFGGVGEQPQIRALRRGVDLIVATPGRLLDLMGQGHVQLANIEHLVLDEADRMLDMGFLPDMRRIISAVPVRRQTLLFSATLSKEIEAVADQFLAKPETIEIGPRSKPVDAVKQSVIILPSTAKIDVLLQLLRESSMEMVLVFSRTKRGADKITRKLTAARISSAAIHANRSQNQRQLALARFRSGEVRVLVATDIAARGIDVDGISHVINFDFPPQPEDYVHRIGRTGRASATGDAVSFVAPDDIANLKRLERFIGRGIPRVDAAMNLIETGTPSDSRESVSRRAKRPHSTPQRSQARSRGRKRA